MLSNMWRSIINFLTKVFANKELDYLRATFEDYKRTTETQLGFLRSQIEYKDQQYSDLLRQMHVNAGLIAPEQKSIQQPSASEPIKVNGHGWRDAQARYERAHARKPTTGDETTRADQAEYWRKEAEKNEAIISDSFDVVGDYTPPRG